MEATDGLILFDRVRHLSVTGHCPSIATYARKVLRLKAVLCRIGRRWKETRDIDYGLTGR